MNKLFSVIVAAGLLLSLVACGEGASPKPASNSQSSPAQQEDTPISSAPADDDGEGQLDGFVKYTPAESKLYYNKDVLVFEFTDATVGTFIERTDAGEEMSIYFGLPQFEATLSYYPQKDGLTAQYNNLSGGESAFSDSASPDFKLDWRLEGNTVQLACKAHGYDVNSLRSNSNALLDVQIRAAGGQTLIINGGMLDKIEMSTEVPAHFAKPLEIENAYTPDSFTLLQYASPTTDDYYVSGSDTGIKVVCYDTEGYAIYSESIYYGSDSPWEQDGGGVKQHPANSKIIVAWTQHTLGDYGTKAETIYWPWSKAHQQKSYDIADMWYFSQPSLPASQMGKK